MSGQVYELIREAIVSLWFKPGEPISEKLVAEQLSVSRTPVREALMRLSDESLIDVFPHHGTIVSPIKLQDVFEGQIVREALELAVVRRASGRITPDFLDRFRSLLVRQRECARWNDFEGFHALDEAFHRTICECSGTPRIWRHIISAKAQLDRVRRLGMRAAGQLDQIIAEHEAILRGLEARSEEQASRALTVHLHAVFESIRVLTEENADYFSPAEPALPQALRQRPAGPAVAAVVPARARRAARSGDRGMGTALELTNDPGDET